MEIRLNGQAYDAAGATVAELLAEQKLDAGRPGIAVALNLKVVPRGAWSSTALANGDDVEIVRPHSGG